MILKNLGKVIGDSAYEIWLSKGNVGTEEDFLNSLKPKKGVDYYTEEDLNEIKQYIDTTIQNDFTEIIGDIESVLNEVV